MIQKFIPTWNKFPLLYLTAYLSLLAVMVVELAVRPADGFPWLLSGLLFAFGVLLAVKPYCKPESWGWLPNL